MRIPDLCHIHNLHKKLQNLPPADIIIHSGDVTMAGTNRQRNC